MLRVVAGRLAKQGGKNHCYVAWTAAEATAPSSPTLILSSAQHVAAFSSTSAALDSQCGSSSTGSANAMLEISSSRWSSSFSSPTNARAIPFSSSALHQDDNDDDDDSDGTIPSNLTFDRKSSFAPIEQRKPILVRPKKSKGVSAEVAEDDDDGTSNVETKQGDEPRDDDGDEYDDDEIPEEDDEDWDESLLDDDEPKFVVPLPERLHVPILDVLDSGATNGTIWLDETVFGVEDIRIDLIKQNVRYIRNKIRGRRKAKTKTISEVSGSGRKVRNQKGTGKARAGHSRPAHWRGGAKAHGPKNTKDYGDIKMNQKAKRLAICSTLSQKLKEGNLIVVDNLKLESHKTKEWARILEDSFGIGGKRISRTEEGGATALIVDHYNEDEDDDDVEHASYRGVPINLWVASSNLFKVQVSNQRYLNVFEILKKDKLMITLSALEQIESRWKV